MIRRLAGQAFTFRFQRKLIEAVGCRSDEGKIGGDVSSLLVVCVSDDGQVALPFLYFNAYAKRPAL